VKIATEPRQQPDTALERPLLADSIVWVLLGVYGCARVLQVFPGRVPMLAVVALHVFPPALFAIIHGARMYRIHGILIFVGITFGVGFLIESLGVSTGFPFGHYYFTDVMGPKLGGVPVMLGLAYVGMAYLSWTLSRVISDSTRNSLCGSQFISVPLLAACIMVSWDLCLDPVWATVLHAWIWEQGGMYFGVPVTNFLGWFLAVFLIYAIFALTLVRMPTNPVRLPIEYWRQAVVFYGVSAVGNLLLLVPQNRFSVVSDPAGRPWSVNSITRACAVITVLTMGVFTAAAWRRIRPQRN
jgi:uncharacterized membrane protein